MSKNNDEIEDLFDDEEILDSDLDEIDDPDEVDDTDDFAGSLSDMVSQLEAQLNKGSKAYEEDKPSSARNKINPDMDEMEYEEAMGDEEEDYEEDEPEVPAAPARNRKTYTSSRDTSSRRNTESIRQKPEDKEQQEDYEEDEYLAKRHARRKGSSSSGFSSFLKGKNGKLVMLAGAVILVLILLILIIKIAGKGGSASSSEQAQQETTVQATEEALQLNANAEINSLIQSYYAALQNANLTQLEGLVDSTAAFSQEKMQKTAEYIESYNNFNCYTHSGLTEDTYIVYASYQVKFRNIDTTAPDLQYYYVRRGDSGSYVICTSVTDEEDAYISQVEQSSQVQALINDVNQRLKEATDADADLYNLVVMLNGSGTSETSAAEENSTTAAETTVPAETDSEGFIVVNETVEAMDNVNVRDSASTDGEILGVLAGGEQAVRIGYSDEWSKIEFDGQIGYAVSEYLSTYLFSNQ